MEKKIGGKKMPENTGMDLKDRKPVIDRPSNFSLRRRKEIYYFCNESVRGILKRVPYRDGVYEINELKTVTEIPGTSNSQKEYSLNVPQNSSTTTNDYFSQSAYHSQKRESSSKAQEKLAGYLLPSSLLNNEDVGHHKSNVETKYVQRRVILKSRQETPGPHSHGTEYVADIKPPKIGCKMKYDQRRDKLKSRDKTPGPQSHSIYVAEIEPYKIDPKTKYDCSSMRFDNQIKKENVQLKPLQRTKQQYPLIEETDSKYLQASLGGEHKSMPSPNKSRSLRYLEELKESNQEKRELFSASILDGTMNDPELRESNMEKRELFSTSILDSTSISPEELKESSLENPKFSALITDRKSGTEEGNFHNDDLRDCWNEHSLSDALNKISVKFPITEL